MSVQIRFYIKLLLLVSVFCSQGVLAQNPANDTAIQQPVQGDTAAIIKKDSTAFQNFLFTRQILQKHPYFNFQQQAQPLPFIFKKKTPGKEIYFYIIVGLLLMFAVFRTAFTKYFSDLMTLFFRRSLKQRQLKQQVSQNSLPSLLFNILYVIAAGFYIALLVSELLQVADSFWKIFAYCLAAVAGTYVVKFLVLKLMGWMFQLQTLIDSYIFIVFLINKIIGIVLLPVVVMVALGNVELRTMVLTLSWIGIAGLYIYRYVQAFGLLRKEKSISMFHFILYLLAFEILPILVIYKAAISYLQI